MYQSGRDQQSMNGGGSVCKEDSQAIPMARHAFGRVFSSRGTTTNFTTRVWA